MFTVNIHQAKIHFSKLIEVVMNGNQIIITKAGEPAARLIPITFVKPKRKPGSLKGKIKIAADFDAHLPDDILNQFEGK
ncbi:MAG: type II toxin-antitoxin system Phd/YefM family antitoxin [Gammaproteobacteria bacterium]|nr:type II toxin-antitoxin system Phd/YefM family antitoxin [Gammaproteobacteria bacterium]